MLGLCAGVWWRRRRKKTISFLVFKIIMVHDGHQHTHSITQSLTHSLTHSLNHSLTHSITYTLTHTLTHSPSTQTPVHRTPGLSPRASSGNGTLPRKETLASENCTSHRNHNHMRHTQLLSHLLSHSVTYLLTD
jgi:hypothetical protein